MNLMNMVNGLNRMDDTNPFSATAFLLAVKMIDLFNRLYWADSVAVDLNRMGVMAKCSSKVTITRARDELVERGVLEIVRKGKKGTPTTYRLNDLSVYGSKIVQNPDTNPVPYRVQNPDTNPVPYRVQNPVPINIPYNVSDDTIPFRTDEDAEEDAFSRAHDAVNQLFPVHFGTAPTPAEVNRMASALVSCCLVDVASEALKETAIAAPSNRLAYFLTICQNWHDEYIRCKQDVEEYLATRTLMRQYPGADYIEQLQNERLKRQMRYSA